MSELRSQLTEVSEFRLQLIEMYFTGVVAGLIRFDGGNTYLSEINEIAKEFTKTHFHDPYYQVELEYFLNQYAQNRI